MFYNWFMSKASRGEKGEQLVAEELNKIEAYHQVLNDITFLTS